VRRALHAEWTKLLTVRGPWWLLVGTVGATVVGVQLGQALVVILAVGTIGGEHATGMLATTFTALPRRTTVLAAKAVTLAGVVAAAGTLAVLASHSVGRAIALGSIPHLVLISQLGLGVTAAVRHSAAGAGSVLALLYLVPVLARAIGDPRWQRLVEQVAPTSTALGATAAWATTALVTGALLLRRCDA
jgi:ABC-2 type transport system permease protein